MKKLFAITLMFFALTVGVDSMRRAEAYAKPDTMAHPIGLGVVFGEPTGITGKVWLTSQDSVDAGLAYSFHKFFLVYVDKLWQFPGAFGTNTELAARLSPYVGVGGGFYFGDDFRLNVRIPLGLEWMPSNTQLGVFAELVPAIRLVDEVKGDVLGGIGVRYYF